MGTLTVAGRVKWAAIALLVLLGLLQLHLPHFLIESRAYLGYATYPGLVLLATMLGSAVAAVGIYRHQRWGWMLGILIAGISWVLYVVQETVGLAGLSQIWWEPTRILSLLLAGILVILAAYQLGRSGREHTAFRSASDRSRVR
jgi:hypothetical protein